MADDLPECIASRDRALAHKAGPHDEYMLHGSLAGMFVIEDHMFTDAAVLQAVRHIADCKACQAWFEREKPRLYPEIVKMEKRMAKYCCAGMFNSVTGDEERLRYSFNLFRGEDPCWCVNDEWTFASYCLWCGKRLPDKPFES